MSKRTNGYYLDAIQRQAKKHNEQVQEPTINNSRLLKRVYDRANNLMSQPNTRKNALSSDYKSAVLDYAKKNNIAIDENNPLLTPTVQSVSKKNTSRYNLPGSGFSSIEQQNRKQLEEEKKNFETKVANTPEYKEYKKQVEEKQTENKYGLGQKITQGAKNLIGGAWNGSVNYVTGKTSELKNDINKSKKEGLIKNALDLMNTANNISNPSSRAVNFITGTAKNVYDSATDKDKSTAQKLGSYVTKQSTNVTNFLKPYAQAANESAQLASNIIGKKNADKVYKGVEKFEEKINTPAEEYQRKLQEENAKYGEGSQYVFNVLNQVGNMAPSIATTAITGNPDLGLEIMGESAKGAAIKEALAKGADLEQAIDIGNAKGLLERETEKISGGLNLFGKGAIDDVVERELNRRVKNEVANFLIKKGLVDNLGENAEEVISDVAGVLIDKSTVDPNAKYTWADLKNTLGTTTGTTTLLNFLGGGFSSNAYKQNAANIQQQTINDATNNLVSKVASEQAINDAVSKIINKNVLIPNNQVENNAKLPGINELQNNTENGIYQYVKSDNAKIDNLRKDAISQENNVTNNQITENDNIKPYTKNDIDRFMTNENNLINNVNGNIEEFVKSYYDENTKKAKKNLAPTKTKKMFLGRINDRVARIVNSILNNSGKFEKTYDTKDTNIVISSNNIEHVYNQHGNEMRPGQIDVTPENLSKYVDVVSNPDYVGLSDKVSRGNTPTLYFTKKINGYSVAVEVLSTKKQLYPESYYVFKSDSQEYNDFVKNNKLKKAEDVVSNELNNSYDINAQGDTSVAFNNDNDTINESKSQIAQVSPQNNMQQNQQNIPIAKQDNVLKVTAKDIAKQINQNGDFNLKQRSWTETSTESEPLKGKVFIEDLDPSKITYEVQSNKKSLDTANKHLDTYGYEKSLDYVKNLIQSEGLPKASDVALMQRMIQEASKRGDVETVQNLIMDTAILGTDLGQATQALSMIQRLTPEGQLKMYTKIVERAKARGEKSFQNVEITPEMVQKILEVYNQDGTYDQNDLNARVEEFKQDLANQMKSTIGEKIDAWRYLSMLGNPKTHIRNVVSNVAMTGTVKVKNAMARTLETILPVKERTKTWKKTSQEIKDYAKQTTQEMKGIITGEGKYNEKSAIESKKQIFKNKALEKISNLNSAALELEDWMFSSRAFRSTFEEYLTANGINSMEDVKSHPEVINKAKNYAVEQAQIATFRQFSKLASMINQFERKSKVGKVAVEALVPFKKTPINVAKAGVSYSPLGLIKNITYDAYQLKQGNINASQFIDNISQGMTGTSLTLLGYALAKAGILKGSGSDDKEGKYDSQLGNTGYSVKLGNNSYSISWLSPVAMPLLVGTNAYEQLEEGKEWDMNVVSDSLAKTLDPLNEMSFMQGVTNAIQSYGSGADKFRGSLESTVQNYVGQFFPTLLSQIASVTDDTKRSSKASANSKYKFGEQTVRSIMYKVPGLRQKLEPTTDIWGNEKKQSDNILQRAFETFIAPYSRTEDKTTDLDRELKRVYNSVGESKVIPGLPQAFVKYGDDTYRMSAKDYTQYKKTYGQKANEYLNELIDTDSYQNASDDAKAKMIQEMYDFAKAEANEEYFKNQNIEYTSDNLEELNTLKDLNITGSTLADYVADKSQISTIRGNKSYSASEKKQKTANVLMDSDLNNKQLAYLYGKYYSSDYTLNNMLNADIPIKEFIKLDSQDFEGEIDERTGRAKTNSKKHEIINYISNLDLSTVQKAFLIKSMYSSYKDYDTEIKKYISNLNISTIDKYKLIKEANISSYDKEIANYVNNNYVTQKQKEQILKQMGFNIYNGKVYVK